jgi:transcription antitermination factor NusG
MKYQIQHLHVYVPGWEGVFCEIEINYCQNTTCENNGVCRPLFMNYTCECLGYFYSGRHCEMDSTKITIYKIVSKSSASISIIALISVAMFVIIMDALKYCFHTDLTHEELERIRRKKKEKKKKHKPIVIRYIYVNAPPSEQRTSIVRESAV